MKLILVQAFFVASVLSLTFTTSVALACEFHGGFGGGYGMNWRPYDPSLDTYADDANTIVNPQSTDAKDTSQKSRPTFSSSATKAANAALLRRSNSKTPADTQANNQASADDNTEKTN